MLLWMSVRVALLEVSLEVYLLLVIDMSCLITTVNTVLQCRISAPSIRNRPINITGWDRPRCKIKVAHTETPNLACAFKRVERLSVGCKFRRPNACNSQIPTPFPHRFPVNSPALTSVEGLLGQDEIDAAIQTASTSKVRRVDFGGCGPAQPRNTKRWCRETPVLGRPGSGVVERFTSEQLVPSRNVASS